MVGGTQAIESRLHKQLVEHLNAEVVLRTITDLGVAMQWLTSTFLYIRARKNPRFYGLSQGLSPDQLDKKLLDMCHIEINKLSRAGMLTMDSNILIVPTVTGTLMARYYVALETMKLFTHTSGKEILQQILSLISKCQEYNELYLRTNDKKALNLLNHCRGRETIRFKLTGKIKTLDMKINCMIQAVLGCLEIMESSLLVEAQKIIRIAERLLSCLAEYLELKNNCYSALLNTLILAKCCRARIWENSPFISRQLSGIGVALSNALVAAEKTTFQSILDSNPRDIERIINRKAPTGDKIRDQVRHLPKYTVSLKELTPSTEGDKVAIEVVVSLVNAADFTHSLTVEADSFMNLLIGDDDNNIVLYEKYTHMYMIENPDVSRTIELDFKANRKISADFISDNWVGIDAQNSVVLFPTPDADTESKAKGNSETKVKKAKQDATYVQHFIDNYFKQKKQTKSKTSADTESKVPDVIDEVCVEKTTSKENAVDNGSVSEELDDDVINNTCEPVSDNYDMGRHLLTNVVAKSNELYAKMSNKNLIAEIRERNAISQLPKEIQDVPAATLQTTAPPSLYSQSSVKKMYRARNKARQQLTDIEFEDSLHHMDISLQEDKKPLINLQEFAVVPKKKIGTQSPKRKNDCTLEYGPNAKRIGLHDETGPCKIKSIVKEMRSNESAIKTLTWSSPLVVSPDVKYSPNIVGDNKTSLINQDSSLDCSLLNESNTSRSTELSVNVKTTLRNSVPFFPLSDKDWPAAPKNSNVEDKQLHISDIVSLELFGLPDEPQNLPPADSQKKTKSDQFKTTQAGAYYEQLLSQNAAPKTASASKTENPEPQKLNKIESTNSGFDLDYVNFGVNESFCAPSKKDAGLNLSYDARDVSQVDPGIEFEKTFERNRSWENEFLNNEFTLNDSFANNSVTRNEDYDFQRQVNENQYYRGDLFRRSYSFKENNPTPGPSQQNYRHEMPKRNDNQWYMRPSIVSSDSSGEDEATVRYPRHQSFENPLPYQTLNNIYDYQRGANNQQLFDQNDVRTTRRDCHCCRNPDDRLNQSFAEEMRQIMRSKITNRYCQDENFGRNRYPNMHRNTHQFHPDASFSQPPNDSKYKYYGTTLLPNRSMVPDRRDLLFTDRYDHFVSPPPSYDYNYQPSGPYVPDKSYLMDKYLHSCDLRCHKYSDPNPRRVQSRSRYPTTQEMLDFHNQNFNN